jgi:hypothetical protein
MCEALKKQRFWRAYDQLGQRYRRRPEGGASNSPFVETVGSFSLSLSVMRAPAWERGQMPGTSTSAVEGFELPPPQSGFRAAASAADAEAGVPFFPACARRVVVVVVGGLCEFTFALSSL